MNELVAGFTRSVYVGVLDVKHASSLLPHYRRFGVLFDRCVEVLVQCIRDKIFLDGRAAEGADALAKALQDVRPPRPSRVTRAPC